MELTRHSKERYAERIMGKDSAVDINSYIVANEEKIRTDIENMVTYGTMIFKGKPLDYNEKQPVRVYLSGTWIVILDDRRDRVITLYKIDLGLGEEFNKDYVSKLLDKLSAANEKLETAKQETTSSQEEYKKLINDNNVLINEYKNYIKNLQDLNESYTSVIESMTKDISNAELEVRECIGTVLGKRVF